MATDDTAAVEGLRAQLDEIGRVEATAQATIDAAIQAGITNGEIARRTGRDRTGIWRRKQRQRLAPGTGRVSE